MVFLLCSVVLGELWLPIVDDIDRIVDYHCLNIFNNMMKNNISRRLGYTFFLFLDNYMYYDYYNKTKIYNSKCLFLSERVFIM